MLGLLGLFPHLPTGFPLGIALNSPPMFEAITTEIETVSGKLAHLRRFL